MSLKGATSFFIACLLCNGTLFSNELLAEVYKWKDVNGKVHFSDRAQSQSAEEVTLQPAISEERVNAARQKSRKFIDRQQRKTDFENQEKAKAASKAHNKALSASKRANYCGKAKRDLRVLNAAQPVYRTNQAGKRRYLEESQRAAEIKQWNKNISRYCR
jgi:hypothetical protein